MKKYDAIVIFLSTLKDEVVQKNLEKIKGEITKLNGSVENMESRGLRSFARRLKKKDAGQYVTFRFSMKPEDVNTFQARLKLNEEIFRLQVVNAAEKPVAVAKPAVTAAPVTAAPAAAKQEAVR